jgi:predicted MPP superfamily phosphohydrolase
MAGLFIFQPQLHILDFILVFPYWWAMILFVEVLPYFVLFDILGLTIRKKKTILNFRTQKIWASFKITIFLVFALYVSFRLYFDSYNIRIAEKKVVLSTLPKELEDISLTLVGDIQVDRFTQRKKIDKLNTLFQSLETDFIFFSGDLVTSGQYYISQGLDILCNAPHSSIRFACMVDHDYWANPTRISNGLKDCGWEFLKDQHRIITFKDQKILITGITNIYSRKISSSQMKALLSNAPDADLKILLIHQPSENVIQIASEYGYHLFLAGHTHGGQVRFKPFGFTLTPSMFETSFYSGLHLNNGMRIAVTNGIGLTLAPIRYHAPAEISVLRLFSK